MTAEVMSAIAADADNVATFVHAFGLMIARMPAATAQESGGVVSLFGHVPLPYFNLSVLDRPIMDDAQFRLAIDLACVRARTCAFGSFIALCPAWAPPDAPDVVAQAGLAPALSLVGMAADRLLPLRRAAPDLEFRLAGDPGVAQDLALVNAAAYGMDPAICECVAEPNLWSGQSFGVVGYVDGRAVTSAATFIVRNVVYVAFVATLPGFQGRGYAEAAIRRAAGLAQQAAGPQRLWLHATEAGRPLYRSMGFEAGAALPLYALAA